MAEPLIEIEGLSAGYGDVRVLWDVSLSVETGEIACIVGSNGAGKTTLLRTICGLERPRAGEVLVDGERIDRASPESMLERGIALVPEGRHVFPHLTVADNLRLGAFAVRRSRDVVAERMERAFEWFPVLRDYTDRLGGTLSGGEQQMLAIARALMSDPSVLCLDEPSLGLAPKVVQRMLEMLGEMRDHGVTILLVEQFAYLALRAADHGYLLENGLVVRSGTGAELLADDLVRDSYLGAKVRRAG